MTGPPTPPTPTPLTVPVPRAPADWIRAVAHVAPARVPVGHTIRAGVSVGLPFVLGALLDAVTSYAGRRREGLLPTAPHAGAELARDIATLGGGAGGLGEARWDGEGCAYGGAGGNGGNGGTGEPQMATGPARRNGDGPGDTGTDFDLGLTPIRDQLAHLETLVGVPPEGVTQKEVAPEGR